MVPRGTLDAERHAHRRERDVAVEAMRKLFLGYLVRCLGGYVVGWARDRVMGYMNVLGVQGDLPEDGLWEICHIDVTLDLCWGLGERKSRVLLVSGSRCATCRWEIESRSRAGPVKFVHDSEAELTSFQLNPQKDV